MVSSKGCSLGNLRACGSWFVVDCKIVAERARSRSGIASVVPYTVIVKGGLAWFSAVGRAESPNVYHTFFDRVSAKVWASVHAVHMIDTPTDGVSFRDSDAHFFRGLVPAGEDGNRERKVS